MIAIRIENKQQFDLLMGHFEAKGWEPYGGNQQFPNRVKNSDLILYDKVYHWTSQKDLTILTFSDFAEMAGIEVKKPVLKIESNKFIEFGIYADDRHCRMYEVTFEDGDRTLCYFSDETIEKIYEGYKCQISNIKVPKNDIELDLINKARFVGRDVHIINHGRAVFELPYEWCEKVVAAYKEVKG
jgi:hypothetical protein